MDIRPAATQDIPALARLHIEGWRAAYGGLVDQGYLDGLSVETRAREWEGWMAAGETSTLIAEIGGVPGGFITWGRTKTAPPGESKIRPQYPAEIYALYIVPDYWRGGIGKALLAAAARAIKESKMNGLCLWVLGGNERACAFYDSRGGQRIGKQMIEIGPSTVKEVCYGWRDAKLLIES